MPYIKREARPSIDQYLDDILDEVSAYSPGELNYVLTNIVRSWIGKPNYEKIAVATGVVENVKQELYRRLATPYEDAKIAENGDVY